MPGEKKAQQEFVFQSALAKCYRGAGSALLHVEYSGVVTNAALAVIGPRIVDLAASDPVIIYWHKAVTPWPYQIEISKNVCAAGKGIFVVRPDQDRDARRHCEALAMFEISRVVFLVEQVELARAIGLSLAIRQQSAALVSKARSTSYYRLSEPS